MFTSYGTIAFMTIIILIKINMIRDSGKVEKIKQIRLW